MSACNAPVCGTGSGNFPQPGDPSNDVVLTAQGVFGGIMVTWTYPGLNPQAVAHFNLYRSTNPDVSTAVRLRTVTGDSHFDRDVNSVTPIQYYYWIESISVNGTLGERVGPASASIQPTVEQMLTLLTGEINSSVLGQDLRSEIGAIIDVRSSLDDEINDRQTGESALSQIISQTQDELEAVDLLVQQEMIARIDADSALVAQVDVLLTKFNDNIAAIAEEATVRADADSAIAQTVGTLQSSLGNNTALLQTTKRVQDGIAAQYMVKADVNGYVTGYGFYNDGSSSQFIIRTDRFALGNPQGDEVFPFIQEGNTTYLNALMVKDATITDAMIDSVVANKISAGTITASVTMTAAHINGGSLNINNTALIDSNGHATLNSLTAESAYIRGNVEATSLSVNAVNIIDTLHIRGGAITIPSYVKGSTFDITSTSGVRYSPVIVFNAGGGGYILNAIAWAFAADNDGRVRIELEVRENSGSIFTAASYVAGVRADSGVDATWELPLPITHGKTGGVNLLEARLKFTYVSGKVTIYSPTLSAMGAKR